MISEAGRALALASWGEGANRQGAERGGRPRSTAPRCECGYDTLARCATRGRSAKHQPFCLWFRTPKSVSIPHQF